MTSIKETKDAYSSGIAARNKREKKIACEFGNKQLELKHWWLAGWHDRDIEIGK